MIRVAPDYQMLYQNKQKEKPKQHYAYDGGRFCKVFTQAVNGIEAVEVKCDKYRLI